MTLLLEFVMTLTSFSQVHNYQCHHKIEEPEQEVCIHTTSTFTGFIEHSALFQIIGKC